MNSRTMPYDVFEDKRIPLAILGAGGYAREVLWLIRECNDFKKTDYFPSAFIQDTEPERWGTTLHGIEVSGWDWFERQSGQVAVIIGVGPPKAKKILLNKLLIKVADVNKESGDRNLVVCEFPTFIHPSVQYDHNSVKFGIGCSITAGCILTTDITVGDHVSLNLKCTVGHDAVIGSFSNISPGTQISGNVVIGIAVDVGTGTTIIPAKKIGDNAVIGAQACVVKDIPEGVTAIGVPAKVIS